jgi:hypothetical protein
LIWTNFFLDGQHAKITAQYSARPFTLLHLIPQDQKENS